MEIANFFWHGCPLTIYEQACLASFVNHGFDVNLWCYDSMDAPEGVTLRDASDILPKADTTKYEQDGRPGNISAFANSFRYRLLRDHEGWWFDTDVFCLAGSEKFTAIAEQRAIVCGLQDKTTINNAAVKVADKRIAAEFVAELERAGLKGPWGFLGPQLFTRVLKKLDLLHLAVPRGVFYPIHWSQFEFGILPARRSGAEKLCAGALTYHIWNEYFLRVSVPKNVLPPEGSYLHALIVENCPAARDMIALPEDTAMALMAGYILRRKTEQFFNSITGKQAPPELV